MNRLYNFAYKNMIIMDDESVVVNMYERLLEDRPVNIFAFTNAEEAMKCVWKLNGDVSLFTSDYNHPGLSALKMAYMIKGVYPRLPVVIITGYCGNPKRMAKENLVDELLAKPFEMEEFFDLVERYCGIKNDSKLSSKRDEKRK